MLSRRITAATLALFTAAALAACDDDDNEPSGVGNLNTTVRFFNAIPSGTTSLDIATNGTVATGNSSIAFGSASSCTRVNNANPGIEVRQAGSTTALPGSIPTLTANGTFTMLVTGTATAPVYTRLDDQFTTPTTGNAAVRIINATSSATTGAGTWDIFVNPGATLGTPNATGIARNSASAYLTVPAGQANTIRLTNTGQTVAVLNIPVSSLTSGTVQTIVVTDAAAGSTTLRTFTLAPCTTT